MNDSKTIKATIIKRHKTDFPNPLVLKKGESLEIKPKKTNYEGWLWCRSTEKKSGWVPENFTEKTEDGYRMINDYDATELSVSVGENLTVLAEESGWVWCLNGNNKKGWVPLENVRKL